MNPTRLRPPAPSRVLFGSRIGLSRFFPLVRGRVILVVAPGIMGTKIPQRNKSPTGWWVASILTRYEEEGENTENPNRRCLAWEDTIILKARDRNQAYRKAIAEGKARECVGDDWIDTKTRRKGKWIFEGLTSLNPVYDELDDGAEIIWQEHHRSAKKLKAWVKEKHELECFQDDGD